MMKRFFSFVFVSTLSCVVTGSSMAAPPDPSSAPSPSKSVVKHVKVSLGVSVIKPDFSLYAQLPQLPSGCGFLLKSVTPDGSGDKAGLKPMDLIWKLGDQILINESQLLVLLSHRKPGEQVKLSYFRSGVPKVADVTLQAWTGTPPLPDVLAMGTPSPPLPLLPMRVISYEDRSASISDQSGTATLTYREGKLWLHVESAKGVETFNDFVSNDAEIARVPALWRNRLAVLQRSLEESVRLRRLPRVRHVPRARPKARMARE
jgi:hypothetical protein